MVPPAGRADSQLRVGPSAGLDNYHGHYGPATCQRRSLAGNLAAEPGLLYLPAFGLVPVQTVSHYEVAAQFNADLADSLLALFIDESVRRATRRDERDS